MDDIQSTPSAWRLLWSPKAMAWWARYRPLASLRIGTLAFAAVLASFQLLGQYAHDEPVVAPAGATLSEYLVIWWVIVAILHGWSWILPSRWMTPGKREAGLVIGVAMSCASCLFTLTVAIDTYGGVVQDATIDPANPIWPAITNSSVINYMPCMFFFGGIAFWLSQGAAATRHLMQMPRIDIANVCLSCNYDLRGTRAAGIGRCPECGAAVEPPTCDEPDTRKS